MIDILTLEVILMLKKLKLAFQKWIDALGEQNKATYGTQGINCCDLNKKSEKK